MAAIGAIGQAVDLDQRSLRAVVRLLIVEILNATRWRGLLQCLISAILNSLGLGGGPNWTLRDLGSLAMFQIPAYDPVAIVMMGFGVVLAAALAFVL